MTIEERIKMYKRKKVFVDSISKALEASNISVVKVDYEVYSKQYPNCDNNYYSEFVVVTFFGGAKSVINVSGNSDCANFRAIGELIDGGHYDQVRYWEELPNNGFIKIDLEEN